MQKFRETYSRRRADAKIQGNLQQVHYNSKCKIDTFERK
jgi:hypothetical protein